MQIDQQQYKTVSVGQAGYGLDIMQTGARQSAGIPGTARSAGTGSNPQFNVKSATRPAANRQQTGMHPNGPSRQTANESNVVKSLLTGQSYIQSNRNQMAKPAVAGAARQQGRPAAAKQPQQQVSLLQSNWQQPAASSTVGMALKQDDGSSQQMVYADIPQDLAPGEKLYAFINGVPYEIVTGSNQELIARPSTDSGFNPGGISLEDLANISAEQETLKLSDYHTGVDGGNGVSVVQQGMEFVQQGISQYGSHISLNNQQLMQLPSDGGTVGTGDDPNAMQVIIMPNEGDGQKSYVAQGQQETIRVGMQDYVLQPGQQLPPVLQDLVARGVDLSNYEFVIQDEDESMQPVYMTTSDGSQYDTSMLQDMSGGLNSAGYATGSSGNDLILPVAMLSSGTTVVNPNDVLALLAEASSAVAQQEQCRVGMTSGINMQHIQQQKLVTASPLIAPEEEDDGEFVYVMTSNESMEDQIIDEASALKPLPGDGFMNSFIGFVQGNKTETLSSVANSTITKKPQMPQYIPDLCRKTVRHPVTRQQVTNFNSQKAKQDKTKTPMTLIFTDPSGSTTVNVVSDSSVLNSDQKQISVTPFMVQNIGGKSVVMQSSEIDRYLSNQAKISKTNAGSDAQKKAAERMSKIIKRKRGSDDESFDESDRERLALGSDSDSDPGWKPSLERKTPSSASMVAKTPVRGRGRGRPRGSGRGGYSGRGGISQKEERNTAVNYILQVNQEQDAVSVSANPSDAHAYQKGDYVMERKDAYKYDGCPIWKIEAGRLLQKFDPVSGANGILHKSASIYSSWSGDIRTSFKAITVELVNTTGRRQEVVKVDEKYLPKQPDDSLEQDALMDLFNIYVQNVVSQALDPSFLAAIHLQQEEYYLGPLRQVDNLLVEAELTVTAQITWSDKFQEAIDQIPYYKIVDINTNVAERRFCQATNDNSTLAVKVVMFYGPVYSRDMLETIREVEMTAAETFYVGQATLDQMSTYHSLHHFKYLLYKNSQEEVNYRRLQSKEKSDETILGDCLQCRVWVQEHLRFLKELLAKCTIVVTVVTKAESDEPTETSSGLVAVEPMDEVLEKPAVEPMDESKDILTLEPAE